LLHLLEDLAVDLWVDGLEAGVGRDRRHGVVRTMRRRKLRTLDEEDAGATSSRRGDEQLSNTVMVRAPASGRIISRGRARSERHVGDAAEEPAAEPERRGC
jgi:hypothetical protein